MSIACLPDTPEAKAEWNEFLRRCPAGTVFNSTVCLDALGARYDLWVLRKDGRIEAGLPLTRGVGGLRTNPLYCKYLGLVVDEAVLRKTSHYYAAAEAFAGLIGGTPSFDYVFHPSLPNWMPFHWMGLHQQTAYTYVLPKSAKDSWWNAADSRLRNAARRGEKGGVRIRQGEIGSDADVDAVYRLCVMPFTSRGAKPLISSERFGRLVRGLGGAGMARLWLAEEEGRGGTSAAVVFEDWRSAYFVFNGSLPDAQTGTNAALLTALVQDAHARDLDFDFEGSMIKPIENFYRSFAAELRPYSRVYQPSFVNFCKRTAIQAVRRFGGYSR